MNRKLDDWIEKFLEFTEDSEPPKSFRHWVGVGTVAAALQRKCWMAWVGTLYPNMYIVLVAPGGRARKSTAMSFGRKFLQDIGIEIAPEASTKEALIRRLKNAAATARSGNDIIVHNSLTAFSSELTVLLGYQDKQFLSYLCDWFDCLDPWRYDTKDKKLHDFINKLWFNLIGGTTPESLMSSLPVEAIGSGFTSRVIFVYEKDKGQVIHLPPNINTSLFKEAPKYDKKEELKKLQKYLRDDLDRIHTMAGEFIITEDFADEWVSFKDYHEKNPLFQNSPLSSYNERRQIHILKLCMVMSASRGTERIIEVKDLETSLKLLEATERNMHHTFAGVGQSDIAGLLSKMITIFATKKEVKYSKLMNIPDIFQNADEQTVQRVINVLVSQKTIKYEKVIENNIQIDGLIIYLGSKEEAKQ